MICSETVLLSSSSQVHCCAAATQIVAHVLALSIMQHHCSMASDPLEFYA